MKSSLARMGLLAMLITSLVACGGGGDSAPASGSGSATGAVAAVAAKDPAASNTANNPNAAFSLVIDAGLSPLTVNSPPVVNFAVIDSTGKHVPGLTLFNAGGATADPACSGGNVKFAIAQLQADDTWRSLISNKQLVTASTSPILAGQSITYAAPDPVEAATIKNPATIDATHPQLAGILTENAAAGYYTYKAAVDVTSATYSSTANAAPGTTVLTNGYAVVKDGKTMHRAALLLCYVDPATKATVKVNPYIDFTVGADGKAVALKDSAGKLTEARKVVDRAACNACHQNFSAHQGARKEPQVCVICHNPGSQDYHNDGQPIDFKLMVHKFHKGKSLSQDYTVHYSVARKTDTSKTPNVVTGVTYPGELRNCVKCHDGSATAAVRTAQGDNWKTKPSKNACFACHDDYKVAGSGWQTAHVAVPVVYPGQLSLTDPDSSLDSVCVKCHGPLTSPVNPAAAHVVPERAMGESYQYNLWKTTLNADRSVTIEYSVSNPKDGSDYDLLDFSKNNYVLNTSATLKTKTFVFGSGAIYVGWGTDDYTNTGATGRPWQTACITTGTPTSASTTACSAAGLPQASNQAALDATVKITNGYNGAPITRGQPVALNPLFDPTVKRVGSSNHFTITSTPIPASATGTGVVAFAGFVNQQKDAASSYSVPVRNVVSYFSLGSGAAVPRRDVVATAKCEVCHDKFIRFGKTTGHRGSRNATEVCVICHNGNNPLNGTVVAGGAVTQYAESAHFKRFIHMVHEEQTVNNKVNATLLGQGNNFPAQDLQTAAYGATSLSNCNMCHVSNSYQKDLGVSGTSVTYDVDLSKAATNAQVTDTDPSNNKAISPKASACSSCHTSDTAKSHMIDVGGASFGTATQADLAAGKVNETCNNCHAVTGSIPVDVKHGLK
ncbi:MAG: OmcA/MtrC family decaheme c-type cytochrome [Sterolibacterium sp.]|nr:OmcA/MtrC family decaheme c-type cytochrome [Sterolibacterium sp.]